MFYLGDLSLLLVLIFVIGFFYLNSKINRLKHLLGEGKTAPEKAPEGLPEKLPGLAQEKISQASVEKKNVEQRLGHILGVVGIMALILGVSFFLKYAFDNNLIGVTGRVILGFIGGIGLVILGQFLRKKYLIFADLIMGGGIGVLYLTIFGAFQYYHLIGQTTAFSLMAVVTLLSLVLSVIDGTINLAALGVVGGFLTPFLVSTGQNNLIGLFGYIGLLDLGILGVALFRRWTKLNYLGFLGTIVTYVLWFQTFYTQEQFTPTFLVISIFFSIFLIATVAHHLVRREKTIMPDLILIVANAAAYFGAAYILLDPKHGAWEAFLAVLLAVVYFILSVVAIKTDAEDRLLNFFLMGVAVAFLTIAIPLQLTGVYIAFAWLAEALILALINFVLKNEGLLIFSIVVYLVGLTRLIFDGFVQYNRLPEFLVFNQRFFVIVVGVAVTYLIATLCRSEVARKVFVFLIIVANALTLGGLLTETSTHYNKKSDALYKEYYKDVEAKQAYYGQRGDVGEKDFYDKQSAIRYAERTAYSIILALYAITLLTVGFIWRSSFVRLGGVLLFFATAVMIFLTVWDLGALYRIVTSIIYAVIALLGSFAYAKYRNKLTN